MATRFDEAAYPVPAKRLDAEEYMREQTLPFHFDPAHNYAADVDYITPPWDLPQYRVSDLKPGAAFSDEHGRRDVRLPNGERRTMAHKRYVRAVDLNGFIGPLSISTVRASPDYPTGYDDLGSADRIKGEKRRQGFLILEQGEFMNGLSGQKYLAWALAVAEKRRIAHEACEAADAAVNVPRAAEKYAAEQRAQQSEMTAELAERVASIVAAAQAPKQDVGALVKDILAEVLPAVVGAVQQGKAEKRKE